ncbi:SMP-30/gluconolactonase/LRE family protein [Deinococcus lacus]|uniref:SMP-30/gluconolactonase/LRE family protein n=1 Tax=Deinococcus lacus TaxID=392561 RepID=A0ABW1YCJ9_9DEIO
MTLSADQPDFCALFPPGAELTRLATGFTWTEGPVWVPARHGEESGGVIFSDVRQNRTWRYSPAGLQPEMDPSHHQNGHCLDAQGRLIACSHGERALLRQEAGGAGRFWLPTGKASA